MDTWLAAARFFHYAAAIQLFGVTVFYWLLMPHEVQLAEARVAYRTSLLSAALLLVSSVAWLMGVAGSMGNGLVDAVNPETIALVLTQTGFGHVWGPHVLLCGLALLVSLSPSRPAGWVLLVLSAFALGSLGLVGHAAMDSGLFGLANATSQILHLLSSGFWLGALIPLLSLIPLFGDPSHAAGADTTLRRFSGLGHFAVAVLMLTGVANSWFILGTRLDLGAPYQQLLLLKAAIAGTMCLLAIANRYVFMPRIPNGGPGARQLMQGTIAEVVLGAAVLTLVSVIGIMSPA